MHVHNSVVVMASTLNEGNSDGLNRYVIVGGGIAGVSCAEEVIIPHMHTIIDNIPSLWCTWDQKTDEICFLIT